MKQLSKTKRMRCDLFVPRLLNVCPCMAEAKNSGSREGEGVCEQEMLEEVMGSRCGCFTAVEHSVTGLEGLLQYTLCPPLPQALIIIDDHLRSFLLS
ncbi:hypothetical protein MHYP_G00084160 [Metynnis hypsauchen]